MEELKNMILREAEQNITDGLDEVQHKYEEKNSDEAKYNFGVALIQTKDKDNQIRGVKLLQEVTEGTNSELGKASLYFIAYGYFRMQNYREAKNWTEKILEDNPNNQQAIALNELAAENSGGNSVKREILKRGKSLKKLGNQIVTKASALAGDKKSKDDSVTNNKDAADETAGKTTNLSTDKENNKSQDNNKKKRYFWRY